MVGLNKVMLIGELGRDPEMHFTPDGIPVTSFSLAVKRTWQGSDGTWREAVEWFNIVAWRRLAEICSQYLRKGECVYLEGRLQTRSWEDQTGQRHYRTEVVANDLILLSRVSPQQAQPEIQSPAGDDTFTHNLNAQNAVHEQGD